MAEQPEGEIRLIGDLQRLELKPGDILVLKTAYKLPTAVVAVIREQMGRVLPGHELIILEVGMELGVLSPTHDELS